MTETIGISVRKTGEDVFTAEADDGRVLSVRSIVETGGNVSENRVRLNYTNRNGTLVYLEIGPDIAVHYAQDSGYTSAGLTTRRTHDRRFLREADLEGIGDLAQAICDDSELCASPSVAMYLDERGRERLITFLFRTPREHPRLPDKKGVA